MEGGGTLGFTLRVQFHLYPTLEVDFRGRQEDREQGTPIRHRDGAHAIMHRQESSSYII